MSESNINKAKDLMELGWKAREDHRFEEAEKLLSEAKIIYEREEDWINVTECLNHLALNYKLQSLNLALKAVKTSDNSLNIANEKNTKKDLVYRNAMSSYDCSGNFEMALFYCNKCLETSSKPILKGDLLSHKATYEMRTGNIQLADKTIDEALDLINKGWNEEGDPHRSIWKCRALLAKATIKFNLEDLTEAKNYAEQALKLATEQNLKTRVDQANEICRLIKQD